MPARTTRRATILVLVAFCCLTVLDGAALWSQMRATQEARLWVRHTYEVLGAAKDLQIAIRDAETGERGFLLTSNEDYLGPYRVALDNISTLQGELRRLTIDHPAQQERVRAAGSVIQRKLEELAQTIQVRRDMGLEAAQRIVQSHVGRTLMLAIEASLGSLVAEEERLLAARIATADQREAHTRWLAALGAALAVALLGFAVRMISTAQRKLLFAQAEEHALAEQLRTSFESITQGIGIFDAELRLARWNYCFTELLGLPDPMARPGTPYGTIAAQAGDSHSGEGFLENEAQIKHGTGGRVDAGPVIYERTRAEDGKVFEMRRTPMPDGGFVLTLTDITARVRAEATIREAQRMQAMGQLTGGIAHDFNNMLAVVLGNLELVKPKLEEGGPMLTRVERAIWGARRAATLTQQLLAFARKQPLAPAPVDLSAMLSEMAGLLRRTLGNHIEVRVVDAAGLWLAMADLTQLESALLNLALNARDAMPGGGRLTIEVANKVLDAPYAREHSEVTPGDYVMLAVSDTGFGMPPEVLSRVFEPFFTTKEPGKGTGLGMAMVFGFAKQSGGHLKIYSEPGEGTTVRLYLPRVVGVSLPRSGRPSSPLELPRGSATVLVLEDNPAVREVAASLLRDLGYRVLEAGDGAEALKVFGENDARVDLLLTDVVLPGGMKGHEVAKRLTEVRPGIRVLFMSGYTENAIVHHGRLDDGVQLISKPFQVEALARKVAEVLGTAAPAAAVTDSTNVVDLASRDRGGGKA